jgi:hypothetical protein
MTRKYLKNLFKFSLYLANKVFYFFGISITFQVERIDKADSLPDYFHHLRPIEILITERLPVVNLAIPYLAREESIFAGTRMILALGAVLLKNNLKVRFVITDEFWDQNGDKIAKNNFYKYFPDCVDYDFEVVSVSEDQTRKLEVSQYDLFVATAWWTVYAWNQIFSNNLIRYKKLFYLIQDFEPGFYPWGSDYSLALDTYKKNIFPIYSTESLRTYFEKVIKIRSDKEESVFYLPEISKETFYPAKADFYAAKRVKRVFCYFRPSIPRNMYRLLLESLKGSIRSGLFKKDDWDFFSGGENHTAIDLGMNFQLLSLGKMSYSEYGEFLRTCDVGISLMFSPHPSYPPFEMAQSGVITITNSFPGKDLSEVSKNIISCEATEESLIAGIRKSLDLTEDYDWRIRNAALPFPNSYEECFLQPKNIITKIFNENQT